MSLRASLLGAGVALLLAYTALLVWFAIEEDSFIYYPERGHYQRPQPSLRLTPQPLTLHTSDAVSIAAWVIAPPSSVAADRAPWLLYCHGNSGNLGSHGYHEVWSRLRDLGVGILALDYRGYGESEGTPSEQGLYRDVEAGYGYLRHELGVEPERIVLYGFSLGSAVAIELASHHAVGALIVEGAVASVPLRAQELYPFLPVAAIARNRFASIDKIRKVTVPKLFIHSKDDEVTPISHSERLHAVALPPKTLLRVTGLHGSAYKTCPDFIPGIARFLVQLGYPLAARSH